MPTAVVRGLASRGGLSNWVLFLRDAEIVLCDVGMAPAIGQGAAAGAGVMIGGEELAATSDELDAWCEELSRTAKAVVTLQDAQITRIRLRQSFLPHQLHIETKDDGVKKFGFLDRPYSARVDEPLRTRFGAKFELVATGPFVFLSRYAPFLLK